MTKLLVFAAIAAASSSPGPTPTRGPGANAGAGIHRALVCRGERVTLSARVGAVIASVEAEALQDGDAGETIRVRNLHNGRVQLARIARAGQVEVVH